MRVLIPGLAAALVLAAASAGAQPLPGSLDAELRAGAARDLQVTLDRQAVQQHNDLMMLDAQLRTQRALSDVQAQNYRPILPPTPRTGAQPQIDTSRLASIPDARLEASNAAVKAAAENRR
jgi:hypothetical protein